MKNALLMFILMTCFTSGITAQQTNNSSTYATRYKQNVLEMLQRPGAITLTSVQKDSVAAIYYDVWQQLKSLKGQSTTVLKNSMETLEAYKMQRLISALQNQSLAQQVASYLKNARIGHIQNKQNSSSSL
jgi:hypothetical protein